MPMTSCPAASAHSSGTSQLSSSAPPVSIAATPIARRSPSRSAIQAAGTSPTMRPMPSSDSTRPAPLTDAPWSSATSAMIGAMAPLAISYTNAGARAEGAILRRTDPIVSAPLGSAMVISASLH
jgi:hypothetical protein